MLLGTSLNDAYAMDDNYGSYSSVGGDQFAPSAPASPPPPKPEYQEKSEPKTVSTSNLDPNMMSADQKLYLLTNELKRQRAVYEQQKNNSYIGKMMSKKRDIMKLVVLAFIVLMALSIHHVAAHYIGQYLEDNALSAGKEFLFRILYPCLVLFALWNIKVFYK
jgi:hypothetical protein